MIYYILRASFSPAHSGFCNYIVSESTTATPDAFAVSNTATAVTTVSKYFIGISGKKLLFL